MFDAIDFDTVAAWRLRQAGWHPEEWLHQLRLVEDGVVPGEDVAFATWRQTVGASPSGAWFSKLTLVVRSDGRAHTIFDRVNIGGGVTYQMKGDEHRHPASRNDDAMVMMPTAMPATMMAVLPGRDVGMVLTHAALTGAVVTTCERVEDPEADTPVRTVIGLTACHERVELPWRLLP